MPIYHCELCNFSTPLKGNYTVHLSSTKHELRCKVNAIPSPSQSIVISESPLRQSESPKSQSAVIPESPKTNEKTSRDFTCKYCEQKFKFKQSMYRHIKYTCTKNKDEDLKELVRLMNIQIEQQKNELQSQKQEFNKKIETQAKQIDKLMGKLEVGNTFNTAIVNNIQLLGYRQTDVSHLTDQDYRSCIKRVNHCVKNMIEKVHFNPSKPENMNIYISNIKEKYIMVYDGANWNLANRKDELDRLYEEKEMMLEEWLDSNPDEELKQKFVRYLNNKDNDECLNRIKEEIKMMIYNSHQKLALKNGV
jgi:hypothetical protein